MANWGEGEAFGYVRFRFIHIVSPRCFALTAPRPLNWIENENIRSLQMEAFEGIEVMFGGVALAGTGDDGELYLR